MLNLHNATNTILYMGETEYCSYFMFISFSRFRRFSILSLIFYSQFIIFLFPLFSPVSVKRITDTAHFGYVRWCCRAARNRPLLLVSNVSCHTAIDPNSECTPGRKVYRHDKHRNFEKPGSPFLHSLPFDRWVNHVTGSETPRHPSNQRVGHHQLSEQHDYEIRPN